MNETANNSGVPLMERLSATFKKKKLGSTQASVDPRGGPSGVPHKPMNSETTFVVSIDQLYNNVRLFSM